MAWIIAAALCVGLVFGFAVGLRSGRASRNWELSYEADTDYRRAHKVGPGWYYVVPEREYQEMRHALYVDRIMQALEGDE